MKKLGLLSLALMYACSPNPEIDISGQWKLLNDSHDGIIAPFVSFCPISYPESLDCHELIYIDSNSLELPLLRFNKDFQSSDKYIGYKILGDKIFLEKDSTTYEYDWQISGNKLCLNGGAFCMERYASLESHIDSTILFFSVNEEWSIPYTFYMNYHYLQEGISCEILYKRDCEPYDSVEVDLSKNEISYLIKLLGRIPYDQLNRIYNNGMSDCREISIDYYTVNGRYKGIETCDLSMEVPFEIRAFASNLLWIIDQHVDER
ncbi:MAG: hypothetical protein AAFO07_06850 [Bacteroidota bacterium]